MVPGNGGVTVSVSDAGADSYEVMASTGQTCTITSPALSCFVAGLTNDDAYTFTVTATVGGDTSVPSAPSDLVTPTGLAPLPPSVTTVVAHNGAATVTIEAGAGGGVAESYEVTASPGGLSCTITAPATSCSIGGLTNGEDYTFAAVAVNAAGRSGSSAPSDPVAPDASLPVAPQTVTGVPGNGGVTVTVSDAGAESYEVMASTGQTCTITAPALSCFVDGLTNDDVYTFTATSTTGANTSVPSAASDPVTPTAAAPLAPTVTTVVAHNGAATVTVEAGAGGGAAESYVVTGSPGGLSCTIIPAATFCHIGGLTNGDAYTFSAVAVNAAGRSGPSAASDPATPDATLPASPTIERVVSGNGGATVAVTDSGADSYEVTASTGETCTITSPALSCFVAGLVNDEEYTFTVTATTGANTSVPSLASDSVTPTAAAPLPPTVTGVARYEAVTVTVSAGGGGTPTSYIVTADPLGESCMITAPEVSCDIDGLVNGEDYTFTAVAMNEDGASAPSPVPAETAPSADIPGQPVITQVEPVVEGIAVTVEPGPGGAATSIAIVALPGEASCTVTPPVSTCTITGVNPGDLFTLIATASNSAGTSQASEPAVTDGSPPAEPSSDGQMTITLSTRQIVKRSKVKYGIRIIGESGQLANASGVAKVTLRKKLACKATISAGVGSCRKKAKKVPAKAKPKKVKVSVAFTGAIDNEATVLTASTKTSSGKVGMRAARVRAAKCTRGGLRVRGNSLNPRARISVQYRKGGRWIVAGTAVSNGKRVWKLKKPIRYKKKANIVKVRVVGNGGRSAVLKVPISRTQSC